MVIFTYYKLQFNEPTQWSRLILGKLIVSQLFKKFSSSYGSHGLIIVFARGHHVIHVLYITVLQDGEVEQSMGRNQD
jgi:hypothetical protein